MNLEHLEQFLNGIDSRYRAVLIAAKRAKQLQKGLRPIFEGKSTKVTTMALEELVNQKVEYYLDEQVDDPPEKEAIAVPEAPSVPDSEPLSEEKEE